MKTFCGLLTLAALTISCRNDIGEPHQNTADQPVAVAANNAPYRLFGDTSAVESVRLQAGMDISRDTTGPSYLSEKYFSGQPALVRSILDSLEKSDSRHAARLAASLLRDAPGEQKIAFETILIRLGEQAVDPLTDLISSDVDWQTRLQALDALGKIGSHDAFEAIATCIQDPNTWVRIGAAHALGNLHDPRVLEPLSDALRDTSDVVVSASLVALGKFGSPHSIHSVHPLLSHKGPRVRSAAVSALGRIGQPESVAHLKPLLEDPDEGVKYKTLRAINAINEASTTPISK
ncbi:MAG TPA: hypothetical protein DIU35_05135 [Candidatus Latescibacteria bacterium]|mgnify:CR=1 FL=1|nr:hypothetical protein [Candidatus Latescibacterota bacterium]|tara:strand:+ start:3071 stop:3943 length:873 start_codon:yes stop_codon:yes gene_type:complete